MEVFKLENGEFVELNRLLKIMGLCNTGGMANTVIADGQVKVNDNVELRKRCKLRAGQIVEFNSHKIIIE